MARPQDPRDPFSSSRRSDAATAALVGRVLTTLFQAAGRNPQAAFVFLLIALAIVVLVVLTPLGWYAFQSTERKTEIREELAVWREGNHPPDTAASLHSSGDRAEHGWHPARQPVRLGEVLSDFWALYFSRSFVATSVVPEKDAPLFGGEPQRAGFPHEIRTLHNEAYLVGYCEELADPVWSAYRVYRIHGPPKIGHRPGSFFPDNRTKARVQPGDYTGSGYDRGHMTPNYAIGSHFDRRAQEETFLLSNIVPQRHKLNAGLWANLEARVADNYSGRFGQVWVITGPVFGPLDRVEKLRGKIASPRAFYTIIAQWHERGVRAEAFVVEQEVNSRGSFSPFLTTIADVERQTGLRFFPELDPAAHDKLAAQKPGSAW